MRLRLMQQTHQIPTDPTLNPSFEAIATKLVPALATFVLTVLRSELATMPVPTHHSDRKLYSLRDLGRYYGVGRKQAKRDIADGRIRAMERKCRGGRIGVFIPAAEAERIYAGVVSPGAERRPTVQQRDLSGVVWP